MRHIMTYRYGNASTVHYFNPGEHLSEINLRLLHNQLLSINATAKIVHPMLGKGLSVEGLREKFANCIITLINVADEPIGFLMSPILRRDGITVGHAGLVVIAKNPGQDLLSLSGLGSLMSGYVNVGSMYVTNISSTPAIIESFTRLTGSCWPSPNMSLVRAPKNYRSVLRILYEEYILKNFLNPESVELDERRFVIRSSSKSMGFNTDFRAISRSSNFKYLNFCFVWLNYDNEEDMIQVGKLNLITAFKIKLLMAYFMLKSQRRFTGYGMEGLQNAPKSLANNTVHTGIHERRQTLKKVG